jgi:predicted phage terminase large subunit-like protein
MSEDVTLLHALLRNDFSSFIDKTFHTITPGEMYHRNWHIDAIAHHLELCRQRKIKRLIITVPPRCLKSVTTSVAFPAYLLGKDPRERILCVSYSQDLALKHGSDMRAVLEAPWYQRLFPKTMMSSTGSTQFEYRTHARGFRLSTSVQGSITGRGANFIIVDDAHKADEVLSETKRERVINWVRNTLFTRLDDKENGVIIVIQQRLHESDLVGHLLESDNWVHLNLPAIADGYSEIPISPDQIKIREPGDLLDPSRHPKHVLDELARDLGSYFFAAQYQQCPAPSGGNLLQWEWFTRHNQPPPKSGGRIIQSWDTANTTTESSDYSVCTTWLAQNSHHYLLDVTRKKLTFPELVKEVVAAQHRHQADLVLIEEASSGISLLQQMKQQGLKCVGVKPHLDKETRLISETATIEAGYVSIPEEAPWVAAFQHELVMFPNGKNDDQVDSLSQYLEYQRVNGQKRRTLTILPIRNY